VPLAGHLTEVVKDAEVLGQAIGVAEFNLGTIEVVLIVELYSATKAQTGLVRRADCSGEFALIGSRHRGEQEG
jgi:hypothetical protein